MLNVAYRPRSARTSTKKYTSLPSPEEESARKRHPTPQNPGEQREEHQSKRIPNSPRGGSSVDRALAI
jgi:hypothetical protein